MKKEETLVLDTASFTNTFAIFSGEELKYEKNWVSNSSEAEELLEEIRNKKINPQRIVVVRGPGNFTSCRIGVLVSNLLGFFYQVPIFGVSVFDFWKVRLREAEVKKIAILVTTGKGKIFANFGNGQKVVDKEKILNQDFLLGGELSEKDRSFFANEKFVNSKQLPSRARSIFLAARDKSAKKQVETLYLRTAGITKPRKAR